MALPDPEGLWRPEWLLEVRVAGPPPQLGIGYRVGVPWQEALGPAIAGSGSGHCEKVREAMVSVGGVRGTDRMFWNGVSFEQRL